MNELAEFGGAPRGLLFVQNGVAQLFDRRIDAVGIHEPVERLQCLVQLPVCPQQSRFRERLLQCRAPGGFLLVGQDGPEFMLKAGIRGVFGEPLFERGRRGVEIVPRDKSTRLFDDPLHSVPVTFLLNLRPHETEQPLDVLGLRKPAAQLLQAGQRGCLVALLDTPSGFRQAG